MPGGGGGEGLCLLLQVKNALENLSGVVLRYKISENLLESKPFKTSRELPYFWQN